MMDFCGPNCAPRPAAHRPARATLSPVWLYGEMDSRAGRVCSSFRASARARAPFRWAALGPNRGSNSLWLFLVDPVPALRNAVLVKPNVFEPAPGSFDYGNRSDVVVIAGDENPANAFRTCDDQRLTEDISRVTESAKSGPNRVANVTANIEQIVVEVVTDRCAANQPRAHIGNEKRCRHESFRDRNPATQVSQLPQVIAPGLVVPVKQEVLYLCVRGKCLSFVIQSERAKPQLPIERPVHDGSLRRADAAHPALAGIRRKSNYAHESPSSAALAKVCLLRNVGQTNLRRSASRQEPDVTSEKHFFQRKSGSRDSSAYFAKSPAKPPRPA